MGFRSNIAPTGRDFFFNPGGNNNLDGLGLETAVATLEEAVERVNALDPPPDSSNPASIDASVTGTYFTGIEIPEFTTASCRFASIITSDAINIDCMGRHTVDFGSLLNTADGGICVNIDGVIRVRVLPTSMIVLGANGIGFNVTGTVDEIFNEFIVGEMLAEGVKFINHTATSGSPVQYIGENVEFFNTNQTFIYHNPGAGSAATILNMRAVLEDTVATTTGSKGIHAVSGVMAFTSNVFACEMLITVDAGAQVIVDVQEMSGDILVKNGGKALVTGGELIGNVEVEAGGELLLNIGDHIGDIQVDGSLSLNSEVMIGDITVTGSCVVDVAEHTGTVSPSIETDGNIDGIINDVRYGDRIILNESVLMAEDFTTQNPSGLDTPYQVLFGGAQSTSLIDLDASGNITINQAGQYDFRVRLQFGRSGSGGFAQVYFRGLVNGAQIGSSTFAKIDGTNDDLPLDFSSDLDLVAGDVVTLEIIRDSIGMDDGGLYPGTVAAGWNTAPSARLNVCRIKP